MLALVVLVQSIVLTLIVLWMWRHRTEHKQQFQLAILEAAKWVETKNSRDLEILSIVKNWKLTHAWVTQGDCEKLQRLLAFAQKPDSEPRTFCRLSRIRFNETCRTHRTQPAPTHPSQR